MSFSAWHGWPSCRWVRKPIRVLLSVHRTCGFGSSLNKYVHFHGCGIDGVFEPAFAPAFVAPTSAATREDPRHRRVPRYLCAMLLTRSDGALLLSCPICQGQITARSAVSIAVV